MDPVSTHTCLRLVKGSHTWPHYYKPVHFDGPPFAEYEVKPGHEEQAKHFPPSPDFDGNKDYQILSWDMEVSNSMAYTYHPGGPLRWGVRSSRYDFPRIFSYSILGLTSEIFPHFQAKTAGQCVLVAD